jgi:RNA polymerase sigma factor (sigma-70 family)
MTSSYPDPSWADEDLVRECLAGNQAAWSALIEKYKKLVYLMPFKYHLPPEEAADVFQGVWSDLYRDLAKIEHIAALRAWLITAAARRCLLHKKRRQRDQEMEGIHPGLRDDSVDPLAAIQETEKEQRIREAVRRLPDRCQKLVQMLFFDQPPKPYEDVARSLGLARGSIGFIRGRCLTKLKAILNEMGL